MTDREIDVLVAEKVMGLHVVARDWPCGRDSECGEYEASAFLPPIRSWFDEPGPVYVTDESGWPPRPCEHREGTSAAHVAPVPGYSTEIASAWRVIEKMKEHRDARLHNLWLVCYCYDRTYASFIPYGFDSPMTEANGEHATPRAICLAALKAVGVSVKFCQMKGAP